MVVSCNSFNITTFFCGLSKQQQHKTLNFMLKKKSGVYLNKRLIFTEQKVLVENSSQTLHQKKLIYTKLIQTGFF